MKSSLLVPVRFRPPSSTVRPAASSVPTVYKSMLHNAGSLQPCVSLPTEDSLKFSDSFWIFDLRLKDELGGASERRDNMTGATRNRRRRRDNSGAFMLGFSRPISYSLAKNLRSSASPSEDAGGKTARSSGLEVCVDSLFFSTSVG